MTALQLNQCDAAVLAHMCFYFHGSAQFQRVGEDRILGNYSVDDFAAGPILLSAYEGGFYQCR